MDENKNRVKWQKHTIGLASANIGPVEEAPKKTSIHLNRASVLAGVETRRNHLLLNIKSDHAIESPRLVKAEQVSVKRFHQKVRISSPEDFDEELKTWLREAYLFSE